MHPMANARLCCTVLVFIWLKLRLTYVKISPHVQSHKDIISSEPPFTRDKITLVNLLVVNHDELSLLIEEFSIYVLSYRTKVNF